MRVLFSSTFGYGHVFPMVPLAQAFLEAGHHVLWATNEPACRLVAEAGIPCVAAGLDARGVQEVEARNRSHLQEIAPPDRAAFAFPNMFGAWCTPPMTEDLLPLAREWRPDLLVHEAAELSSPLVGAVLGVPSLTHSFGGAVPPAFYTEAGHRLEHLWNAHGQDLPAYAGCFASTYLDICPPSVQPIDVRHIPLTQPLRPVPWSGAPVAELPPYLRRDDRPLVYLTLGTVNHHSAVLRPAIEALAALPVRVLVTLGPGGTADVLGVQPPNVTLQSWVPQSTVLEHCDVVASHAGSGTFLGALSAGLPQLCLPQAADQFRNAGAGVRRGAALALSPDEANGEAMASAVASLLEEPSFRTAAGEVAREITSMPAPAEVVRLLASGTEGAGPGAR